MSKVVQGAESRYISLGNSSISQIWSSGLFLLSLSYSWPSLNKRWIDVPIAPGLQARVLSLTIAEKRRLQPQAAQRATNGCFFLMCANQQVTYYVNNRQRHSYHHSFSRHVMTERTKSPLSTKRDFSVSDSSTGCKYGSQPHTGV